jgi:N utilization substance protein B
VLFEIEGTAKDPEFALRYQGGDLRATADVLAFARTIVVGCVDHLDAIDTAIVAGMDNWALVDLGKVERAVLRLGTFELLYTESTPVAVVIDESIELAKAYAGDEAAQFINGVLGHIARERV